VREFKTMGKRPVKGIQADHHLDFPAKHPPYSPRARKIQDAKIRFRLSDLGESGHRPLATLEYAVQSP